MSRLEDKLAELDRAIDPTVNLLRYLEINELLALVCSVFLMRQLNYADSVKTLMELHRPESACIVARVMLEGTACLWWVVGSEHAEARALRWTNHAYREALKLPEELEDHAEKMSNVVKIKKDAQDFISQGEVFKGNRWTIDEAGKEVQTRSIIEGFLKAKMSTQPHLYVIYQQLSGFVHWSTASFPIDNFSSDKIEILELSEDYKVMCVQSALESLTIMTKLVGDRFPPSSAAP